MVAENTTGARILTLPVSPAGHEQCLLELLEAWAPHDWWTGPQDVLARELDVDARTVRRWVDRLEQAGLLATRPEGRVKTYQLLARPAASPSGRRTSGHNDLGHLPIQMSTVDTTPDMLTDIMPDMDVRGASRDRARDSVSSSSSSDPGHPTPDTKADIDPGQVSTQMSEVRASGGDDGGGDDGGRPVPPLELTAAGMFVRMGLEPMPEVLEAWSDLDAPAQAEALRRLRTYHARTPRYALGVLRTLRVLQQARRLLSATEPEIEQGRGSAPAEAMVEAGGAGAIPARHEERALCSTAPTFAWRRALPWIVSAAAVAALLIRRRR